MIGERRHGFLGEKWGRDGFPAASSVVDGLSVAPPMTGSSRWQGGGVNSKKEQDGL